MLYFVCSLSAYKKLIIIKTKNIFLIAADKELKYLLRIYHALLHV